MLPKQQLRVGSSSRTEANAVQGLLTFSVHSMLARLGFPRPAAPAGRLARCWLCSASTGSEDAQPSTLPDIGSYGEDPAAVGVAAAEEAEAAEKQPENGNACDGAAADTAADATAAGSEAVGPKPVAGQEDGGATEYPDAPATSGHAHAGWPQWK